MKLTELLTERVSDIVYRIVSTHAAWDNLKTNTFKLAPVFEPRSKDAKFQKGKLCYLSLARIKSTSYTQNRNDKQSIMFVIDGRKLSQNYKSVPVNYYSTYHLGNWGSVDLEAEDRIISDKPIIPNAMKYIKEIHVYVIDDFYYETKALREIDEIAKRNNIPIYFYTDKKDFRVLNKRKAITKIPATADDAEENSVTTRDTDELAYQIQNYSILRGLLDFYENQTKPINSGDIRKLLHYYKKNYDPEDTYYTDEVIDNFLASIHKEHDKKGYKNSKLYIAYMDRLGKYMRKERSENLKDFVETLVKKYLKLGV